MIDDEALKSIEKLHQLKGDGVISEEDFDKAKEKILFGAQRAQPVGLQAIIAKAASESVEYERPAPGDYFGWMTLPIRRYADFTGRSCRKEFWMFQLLYVCLFFVTFMIVGIDTEYGEPGIAAQFAMGLLILAVLGLFIPLIAVEVRRFHDMDKSGWHALINLIPYLGTLIVMIGMMLDGTPGENRFGPSPKEQ